MRKLIILLLIPLLFLSCQAESGQAGNENEVASIVKPTITDSLRRVYYHYYNAMEAPFPTHCIPERNKVNPADAAPLDTVFFIFREQLKEIVAAKDIFKLLEYVDEHIKVGFSAENGLKAFIDMWELNSPEQIPVSELWPTLENILNLGGLFNKKGDFFTAPYLDACYPANPDASSTGAVIGAGVRMRAGPSLDSKILGNLSYDILEIVETTPIEQKIGQETYPWIKIKTLDGVEGFIWGKFFRSPIDYRVGFQKKRLDGWKMVTLLAGE